MIRIDCPFRLAEQSGCPLIEFLESDPGKGNAKLAELVEDARHRIDAASDSILYVLSGPEPARATPMQYGGFFLERDRELLEHAKKDDESEVWLYVDAGEGAYLDFVSDLPADVFAWDSQRTGFSLSEMRKLRPGRLCTNEVGSDKDFSMLDQTREAVTLAT
jgi:hypothetical protein